MNKINKAICCINRIHGVLKYFAIDHSSGALESQGFAGLITTHVERVSIKEA
jgi:hypothetical protein